MSVQNIFKKIHLKTVLIVPFITLIVIAVGFVWYLSFRNGQKSVVDVAYQLQSEISKRIEGHLHTYLSMPRKVNQINAISMKQGQLNTNNQKALEQHFWNQVRVFNSVSSIYFGNTLGGLVNCGREKNIGSQYVIVTDDFKSGPFKKFDTDMQGNRTDLLLTVKSFDARTRQWYSGAVKKGTDFWSSVYILFTGQDLAVAASRPVYDKHSKLVGVVSIDLFLSHISNFLQSLTIGKKGHAFIIERSGLLIASSSGAKLFTESGENSKRQRLKAVESTNPMIQYAAESLRQRFNDYRTITNEQKIIFQVKDQRYFLQVSPLQGLELDWLIAVIVSEEDFMTTIKKSNRLTAIFIIVTLIIVLFLCVFIAQKIARPILLLNAAAQNLSKGRWEKKIGNKFQFFEINMLTESFNQMTSQLQQMLNDLHFEIVERKQVEEELHREKAFTETALNTQQDTFFLFEIATGKAIRWNQAFNDLTGYTDEEIAGMVVPDSYYGSEDLERAGIFIQNILKIGTGTIELELICKDGRKVPCEYNVSVIKNEEGEQKYFISIGRNITERKKIGEMMIQSEKMLSVGGLAAGMAHEINNPLAGMIQNAQVINNRLTKDLPVNKEVAKKLGTSMSIIKTYMQERGILQQLESINKAGMQAAKIVENMLSFARKSGVAKNAQSFDELIDKAISLAHNDYNLKKKYDFKKVKIIREYSSHIPAILCDESKIQQVLFNIIKNASEAMGQKSHPSVIPRLIFRLKKLSNMVELEIEDNGPGMDDKTRNRVFEPFFTTKDVDKGTGLGLSVSYFIIVDDHKGEMRVESILGKGTKFIIKLPF